MPSLSEQLYAAEPEKHLKQKKQSQLFEFREDYLTGTKEEKKEIYAENKEFLRLINPEKYDKLEKHIKEFGLEDKVKIIISDDVMWNWDDGLDIESL